MQISYLNGPCSVTFAAWTDSGGSTWTAFYSTNLYSDYEFRIRNNAGEIELQWLSFNPHAIFKKKTYTDSWETWVRGHTETGKNAFN